MLKQSIARNSIGLSLFAIFTAGLIAVSFAATRDRIAANSEAYAARILYELVPNDLFDQPLEQQRVTLYNDARWESLERLSLRAPRPAYQAILNGEVTAVVLPLTAPGGYTGDIHLLVALNREGRLLGVRVTEHRETPGLGDAIEADKSNWIRQFDGRSLFSPLPGQWAVQKDGGEFDQLTGATITPRAIVRAVRGSLEFFGENQALLLDPSQSIVSQRPQAGAN
ncbi:electron transport complex subunit RsxG [Salinispirillum sp. LH 10-3-1]|uniref:Ion-translocating oxidoreductase complex subunit G n=1 Tax=Salinispirillum sp. LH 10-3-1 TaxID=2952525 RepID=A0AB38YCH6_9GAMM